MSTHLSFISLSAAEQENRFLPRTNMHSFTFRARMPEKYDIAAFANPDSVGRVSVAASRPTIAGSRWLACETVFRGRE
ncbi:hypothetical protein [Komagataeibacter kakiaceti]|uniref:hypothetical protein n=1 Tax=Komagataeibacter kakiaceti TaxID=943261 RepID=UPI00160FA619|nr:hypothetical protein [Komagataeibacter kakiaceti]